MLKCWQGEWLGHDFIIYMYKYIHIWKHKNDYCILALYLYICRRQEYKSLPRGCVLSSYLFVESQQIAWCHNGPQRGDASSEVCTLSSSMIPFFHSPFLQRRCPVSKFPVFSHVLLVPPLVQLVQFQLHCRPPTTQSIFFLPESLFWFISQMSNFKRIWTVKCSLDFEVIQNYKNWNFLKFRDCLVWGPSQRNSLSRSS